MAWFKRNAHPEDQLSAFVDGELSQAARRSVQAHLAGCEACSTLAGELQATKSMLAALPQLQPRRSFALGREYAVEPRPAQRRSSFAFAPVAALTVFLALVAVDLSSSGSTSNDAEDGLATSARQSQADNAGAAESASGGDAAGARPESLPDGSPVPAIAADAPAADDADEDLFVAPQPPEITPAIAPAADQASSDGTSLLRILEACAAVAFAASLLIVLWPRIRQRGER